MIKYTKTIIVAYIFVLIKYIYYIFCFFNPLIKKNQSINLTIVI